LPGDIRQNKPVSGHTPHTITVQESPPTGFEILFYRYKMFFVLLTHGK